LVLLLEVRSTCLVINGEADATLDVLSGLLDEGVAAKYEVEVRELLLLNHVDATVKHDGPAAHFNDDAAPPNVLTSTKRYHFYWHVWLSLCD